MRLRVRYLLSLPGKPDVEEINVPDTAKDVDVQDGEYTNGRRVDAFVVLPN